MKPITLKDLEEQLQLAKDRVFIMKYYEMENDIESLNNIISNLRQEIDVLLRARVVENSSKYTFTGKSLADVEMEAIKQALKVYKTRRAAADSLGITLKTLYNMCHSYNIDIWSKVDNV